MAENKLQEKYDDLRRRYNSMCEASDKNQAEMGRLAGENSALKTDVIRLGEEARLAQQNAQLLGDDFNERSKEKDVVIGLLTNKLRENGLSTEVN